MGKKYNLYARAVQIENPEKKGDDRFEFVVALTREDETDVAILKGTSPHMLTDEEYSAAKLTPTKGACTHNQLHDKNADELLRSVYKWFYDNEGERTCIIEAEEIDDGKQYAFSIGGREITRA